MDAPVRVQLRIKPEEEAGVNDDTILLKLSSTKIEFNQEKEFQFDYIYDYSSQQTDIFNKSAIPLLEQLIAGFNVTIMAYGPTGSGKSHTLGTAYAKDDTSSNHGLLPRIITWIFSKVTDPSHQPTISEVKVSFLEIYKEELFDLLPAIQTKIEIKNDKVENVVLGNITEVNVTSQVEALKVIENATFKRQVKKTKANDSSSRSHAIITITLGFQKEVDGAIQYSRIRIVDLAGSEAVAKDGILGETKNEGIFINKGLLALGKVINALNTKVASHIPYRESVLTRTLKDSLSGNSLTVLICCIKSDFNSIAATSATLQFAAKARALKTKVVPLVTFKTPCKGAAPNLTTLAKTPTPFKTPGKTTFRTPLVQIQQPKKVITPGGSTFAFPNKMNMQKQFNDLDESVMVSSSYGVRDRLPMESLDSIENRISTAVMGRLDTFFEEIKEKLNQSILSSGSHSSFIQPSVLESTFGSIRQKAIRDSIQYSETLNITAMTDNSLCEGPRRRSTRLAEKRSLNLSNATLSQSNEQQTSFCNRSTVGARRAPTLPLPTPKGKTKEHLAQYKEDMLSYLNNASQSQMQKLPSVGPKAAHCIISFRSLEGNFGDLESLKLVPGLRKNFYDTFLKVNLMI